MAPVPRTTIRHGLSGFGPRNSMLFRNAVVDFLSQRAAFNKINLKLEFYVFEKASEEDAGTGPAWDWDCEGAMNSGLPGAPSAPAGLDPAYVEAVNTTGDLAGAVARQLQDRRAHFEDALKLSNPAGYALLRENTRADGTVDTNRAFCHRGLVGQLMRVNLAELLKLVRENVPEIHVWFYFEVTVTDVDFTHRTQPQLVVKDNGSDVTQSHKFDFIHLGHGTTGKFPLHENLKPLTFSDIPNHDAIRDFFAKHEMLDANGLLKCNSKIGIAGMRLSAYDPIPVILTFTDILETTADGWTVNRRNTSKYRGLFTFISSRDGAVAPPRHAHSMGWPGAHHILSTSEVHALRLHRSSDYTTLMMPILRASVALELDDHPVLLGQDRLALEQAMSTHKRMTDYHGQNEAHRNGGPTELAYLRAGQLALFGGFGFEADPARAQADLTARAPWTRRGRGDMALRHSLPSDVTTTPGTLQAANAEFFRHYHKLEDLDSAAPVAVQDLIAQLFEVGVARHLPGTFDDIRLEDTPLFNGRHNVSLPVFRHKRFNALFAANDITASADVLLGRVCRVVREVVAGVPEYYKGRFLQNKDGEIINCTDTGLGGLGREMKVRSATSVVGRQWTDVNSYTAAAEWAKTASKMLLILSAIQACGSATPVEEMIAIYQQNFPTNAEFDTETAIFAKAYREVHEKNIFLRIADTFARDAPYDFVKYCMNPDSRETCIEFLENIRPGSRQMYRNELDKIPEFDPINRTEFYMRRHLDFTDPEMDHLWDATTHAIANR